MPSIQIQGGPISCGDTHGDPGHKVFINGKSVILQGDESAGHGCFPPSPAIEGSPNVFVNGIPVVRAGDRYAPHTCDETTHVDRVGVGGQKVFANGS